MSDAFEDAHDCAAIEEECAYLRAQLERATDLVRYARAHLHDEGLISREEYTTLLADSENGQRTARLAGYDTLRTRVAALEEVVAADDAYRVACEAFIVAVPGERDDEPVIAAKERCDRARVALAALDAKEKP